MDPLTAALQLANTIAEIVKQAMADQPPEVKRQLWEWYVQDAKAWRDFWARILPKV